MSGHKIRLAVVDDHPLLLEGVVQVLSQEDDVEVVATGGSAADAITIARDHLPDVMLIDMNMPGTGLHALKVIGRDCPMVRSIALTVRDDTEMICDALTRGARAYVLKGIHTQEFLRVVRIVSDGGSFISPALADRLLKANVLPQPTPTGFRAPLSDRERLILAEIGNGQSSGQIARALQLKERTITKFATNILQKIQVRSRVDAAVMALAGADAGYGYAS